MDEALLHRTADLAARYLRTLPDRHVGVRAGVDELRAALGGPLPDHGEPSADVVERLATDADPGLVASSGPRFFGFVVGGTLPAALAADWLVSAWDQNAGMYVLSPATAVLEEVAAAWVLDLLALPGDASVGFVTGATMANLTGLAAARHAVLERVGWDVETDGLHGAPPVRVFVGEQVHVSALIALRLLGFGTGRALVVPSDDQGRMRADELERALAAGDGPAIVCAQAGDVNSGAVDPLPAIADACAAHGAWLHVDGAFGLWAAASDRLRDRVRGVERADSWVTDGHKWLNVPYDCGIVVVRDPRPHRAAMSTAAAYLPLGDAR